MTTETTPLTAATKHPQDKQRGALKTKRDEIDTAERLPKPDWILLWRVRRNLLLKTP